MIPIYFFLFAIFFNAYSSEKTIIVPNTNSECYFANKHISLQIPDDELINYFNNNTISYTSVSWFDKIKLVIPLPLIESILTNTFPYQTIAIQCLYIVTQNFVLHEQYKQIRKDKNYTLKDKSAIKDYLISVKNDSTPKYASICNCSSTENATLTLLDSKEEGFDEQSYRLLRIKIPNDVTKNILNQTHLKISNDLNCIIMTILCTYLINSICSKSLKPTSNTNTLFIMIFGIFYNFYILNEMNIKYKKNLEDDILSYYIDFVILIHNTIINK